jgi:predicted amidophosphoribosyltransferase
VSPEVCPTCGDDVDWCPEARCGACGERTVGARLFGSMHYECAARLLGMLKETSQ